MRNLRWYPSNSTYLLTNRVYRRQFRLVPGHLVKEVLVRNLGQASSKYGIILLGFVMMSNHFHILAHVPSGKGPEALSAFMCMFQSRVSRELNGLQVRDGYFWQGRYHCVRLLDSLAVLRSLFYVVYNPVKALLVRLPSEWPGVVSHDEHFILNRFTYEAVDREAWNKAGRPRDAKPYIKRYVLECSSLNETCGAEEEMGRAVLGKYRESHQKGLEEHPERECLGVEGVKRTSPWDSPKESKGRRMRGRHAPSWLCESEVGGCGEEEGAKETEAQEKQEELQQERRARWGDGSYHGTTRTVIREHREAYGLFVEQYQSASEQYRKGDVKVLFPEGSFAPSLYPRACFG